MRVEDGIEFRMAADAQLSAGLRAEMSYSAVANPFRSER